MLKESVITSQILYEDNHVIVINKLPSQIVQGDKTGDICLAEMVKLYLKSRYNKPGNVYCGVVHRLDRPVSGAVIFAKTEKALVRLNKQIHDREIEKIYWAITRNHPPKEEGILENFLLKNEKQNKSYVVSKETKGALLAKLRYKLIAKSDLYNLLEVELYTGRHHQIRVQLSHIGCFIKGDLKYGDKRSNKDASISLHARKVIFNHPTKNEKIVVKAPVPDDILWKYFEKEVEALSK